MRRLVALLKKTQILLLACLFIMIAMIVFCAFNLFATSSLDVAFAQESSDTPFVIKATDFYADYSTALWTVTHGEDVVFSKRGVWNTGDSSAVSIEIRNAIREELKQEGVVEKDYDGAVGTYCTIQFDFGDIDATVAVAEGVYSEKSISINASIDAFTTFSPRVYFEYRSDDDDNIKNVNATRIGGGYATPSKGLSYGNYYIRLVAKDETSFEKINGSYRKYTTYRYSEWMECSVEQAKISLPEKLCISAEYGTKLADMNRLLKAQASEYLKNTDGSFIPLDSSAQSESALVDVQNVGDVILDVREGCYSVEYEYVSNDKNYTNAAASVEILITAKRIQLMISDAFSFVGEPLNTPKYYLFNPADLVGDDTIEDLNISFDIVDTSTLEKTDGSVVGKFKTIATTDNTNYTIGGYSADTQFWEGGGRYWVCNKTLESTTEDGIKFFVYINGDIVDNGKVTITKTDVDEPLQVEGKKFLCAYKIVMFDLFGGEISPTEDYTIYWEDIPYGAEWVAIYDDGFDFIKVDSQEGITLKSNQNTIYFFMSEPEKDEPKQDGKEESFVGAYVAIGVTIGLALIFIAFMFMERFMGTNIHKNDVYVCENAQQTPDCENNEENISSNNDVQTENKKQRHGKKNKELNGTKRGNKQ